VPADDRQHHLDAVRTFAMLLGIVLHASLSYFDSGWAVNDGVDSEFFAVLLIAIHGFRMPLFFLLSGYFTALLVQRRGIAQTAKNRLLRITIPLAIGAVTIVPLTTLTGSWASSSGSDGDEVSAGEVERPSVWPDVIHGDVTAVSNALLEGANPSEVGSDGSLPVHFAVVAGDIDVVAALHEAGADLSTPNIDDAMPLALAVWAGHSDVAEFIFSTAGAEGVDDIPVENGKRNWEKISWFGVGSSDAGAIVEKVRQAVHDRSSSGTTDRSLDPWDTGLHHLWFLWHLTLIAGGYLLLTQLRGGRAWQTLPAWVVVPGALIATAWLQMSMSSFGPDTSTSLIPSGRVLAYYAVFFAVGVSSYSVRADGKNWMSQLSRAWLAGPVLGAALGGVLWAALDAAYGDAPNETLAGVLQTIYTWQMIVGVISLASLLLNTSRRWIRFVSDSSYWLYLAHLPLVLIGQRWLQDVDWPIGLEFLLLVSTLTLVLLISYRWLIRPTPIGWLLNGRPKDHQAQ
jgi:surface polysaccharide O-acyltransferase-like enzyme